MNQPEETKTSTQSKSSQYYVYHKDSLLLWLKLKSNQEHFIQNAQLLERLFNSKKNSLIQIKKEGGKTFLMGYIFCLTKPDMIDKRYFNKIPQETITQIRGKDVIFIKFDKRITSPEQNVNTFHDFFREDIDYAFGAWFVQRQDIKLNEEEGKRFNQLKTSCKSIGDYFTEYLSFVVELNQKQHDILILIDDFDVITTASKCYFRNEQSLSLRDDIHKIFAAVEKLNIRTLVTCTQRFDINYDKGKWELLCDIGNMELFHSSLDYFVFNEKGRTRNDAKSHSEKKQLYQDERNFIIMKHAQELSEQMTNPHYQPQQQQKIKLHEYERKTICLKIQENKKEGLATLDKLLEQGEVEVLQNIKKSIPLVMMLRNYGLIYQSRNNLFKVYQEQKTLLEDTKGFIGLFHIQHVDIFNLLEKCSKLVKSIPDDDQFLFRLNDIVQMKAGQWTQQTTAEAEFEVLVSGVFSICGGDILILCQQETGHRKRLDAIIFRNQQGDSTYIVLINEYKIQKEEETFKEQTVNSAIYQIISKNYVDIGLKLCRIHEIENPKFKFKGLALHIDKNENLLVTHKNVCIEMQNAKSLSQFVDQTIVKHKGLAKKDRIPAIRADIINQYIPHEIIVLTKGHENIEIKLLIENINKLVEMNSSKKRDVKPFVNRLKQEAKELLKQIQK